MESHSVREAGVQGRWVRGGLAEDKKVTWGFQGGVSVLEQEPKKSLPHRAMGVNSHARQALFVVCDLYLTWLSMQEQPGIYPLWMGNSWQNIVTIAQKTSLMKEWVNGGYLQQGERGVAYWSMDALWKPLPIMGDSLWAGTWITLKLGGSSAQSRISAGQPGCLGTSPKQLFYCVYDTERPGCESSKSQLHKQVRFASFLNLMSHTFWEEGFHTKEITTEQNIGTHRPLWERQTAPNSA